MPGIARRRRQPGRGSAACRSTRPAATSRAALTRASARPGAQVHGLQPRGRDPGHGARRGDVAQAGVRAPRPVAADDPPLDRGRALVLDELLADAPRERLERLGTSHRPQPRRAPDRRADERVEAEALAEGRQVVLGAERARHPLDGLGGDVAPGRPAADHQAPRRRLRRADDGGAAVDVQAAAPRRRRAGAGRRPSPPGAAGGARRDAARRGPRAPAEHPTGSRGARSGREPGRLPERSARGRRRTPVVASRGGRAGARRPGTSASPAPAAPGPGGGARP